MTYQADWWWNDFYLNTGKVSHKLRNAFGGGTQPFFKKNESFQVKSHKVIIQSITITDRTS